MKINIIRVAGQVVATISGTPPAAPGWCLRCRHALLISLAVKFLLVPVCGYAQSGWYPAAGLLWVNPTDSAVAGLYDPGPGLTAAMGYDPQTWFRLELRLDWFRRTARPDPILAESVESRLTWTPFSLEGHFQIMRRGAAPYLLAGPSLVFSEERFRYTLMGNERGSLGRRTDMGAVVGAGIVLQRDRLKGRVTFRALISHGDREVLRSTGRTDPRSGSASPSHWSVGFELRPW